jgi:hypothetical protein
VTTIRLPYAMQDALSLLVMGRRPVGRGVGTITTHTAKRLVEKGYAVEQPSGYLEVTEQGRAAYDEALARSHQEKPR